MSFDCCEQQNLFWDPFEEVVGDLAEFEKVMKCIFDKRPKGKFAWRGQGNASWSLHSSLYRVLIKQQKCHSKFPRESDLREAETRVLKEFHQWGLHMGDYGRLSVMNQLAVLQHYGCPTRFIDVTFNPWIAAWFAVKRDSLCGKERPCYKQCKQDRLHDARVFAFDVKNVLISEIDENRRFWEDNNQFPWPKASATTEEEKEKFIDWTTGEYFVWKPPHFHKRLAAQNGAFLFSGVPTTKDGRKAWPKSPSGKGDNWLVDDVRKGTSIALRPHSLISRRPPNDATYSIRILHKAKGEIREYIEKRLGFTEATLFPDYMGFSDFSKTIM